MHKVIPGSLADRDGRIQRGDRVLSINGKNLRGVTHREALAILKVGAVGGWFGILSNRLL